MVRLATVSALNLLYSNGRVTVSKSSAYRANWRGREVYCDLSFAASCTLPGERF